MSDRPWFDELQRELSQRGLPRHEVARLVAELTDHLADVMESRGATGRMPVGAKARRLCFDDFKESHMSMDANVAECLGSPAEIAASAEREYRKRGLLRRSQLAKIGTFVLLPIPLLILGWVAVLFGIGTLAEFLTESGPLLPEYREVTFAKAMGMHLFMILAILAPAAGLAALYGRLAVRTGRRWKWGLIACLIVALVTGLSTYELKLSEMPEQSQLTMGLGIGAFQLRQLWQFLVPAVVGFLILHRSAATASRSQPVA